MGFLGSFHSTRGIRCPPWALFLPLEKLWVQGVFLSAMLCSLGEGKGVGIQLLPFSFNVVLLNLCGAGHYFSLISRIKSRSVVVLGLEWGKINCKAS